MKATNMIDQLYRLYELDCGPNQQI